MNILSWEKSNVLKHETMANAKIIRLIVIFKTNKLVGYFKKNTERI